MIPKDWVREAAQDIIDKCSGLRRVNDVIWPDDEAVATADRIAAIIMKHVPFQRDVAYMPVPRCDRCRYWAHRGIRDYCENPRLRLRASFLFVPPLETTADFGCVQWEAK